MKFKFFLKLTNNIFLNAFSVLAISEQGGLLSAPDAYMEKIVVGANLPKNLMDLDNSVENNLKQLAEAKKIKISVITFTGFESDNKLLQKGDLNFFFDINFQYFVDLLV